MESIRFIHTADLHLDSPFIGLKRITPDLQLKLQDATFRAWERIVEYCIEHQVDFLTIAGDLFDQPERTLRAQVHVREQTKRLQSYGIQVYIIHGNHDHCSGKFASMEWPDNVHIFPAGRVVSQPFIKDGRETARIYGISYPKQAVTDRYVQKFKKEKDAPFSIGLLHTNVAGEAQHENYAPATVEELFATGLDFWGLGHVHTTRILHPANPVILYPGNPQGRHIREQGEHGCYLIEVDTDGHSILTFLPTDQVRWNLLETDISGCEREDDLLERVMSEIGQYTGRLPDCTNVLRIRLQGQSLLHTYLQDTNNLKQIQDALQSMLQLVGSDIWLEQIEDETIAEYDLETLRKQPNFIGDYLAIMQEMLDQSEPWEEINSLLHEFYGPGKPLPTLDEEEIRKLLRRAGHLGLQMLLEAE